MSEKFVSKTVDENGDEPIFTHTYYSYRTKCNTTSTLPFIAKYSNRSVPSAFSEQTFVYFVINHKLVTRPALFNVAKIQAFPPSNQL